uniref:DUF5063 domain-containing protein n=1 Tax=Ndongobacter massiliensis TaxID=1871025 RepID=UPI0009314B38|nr:DUF5063 domain-containing protein [Ndongobacter massiliensis]
MNRDIARKFYERADEYCCFIAKNVVTVETVPSLIEILVMLYIAAMNLPEAEPETIKRSSNLFRDIPISFHEQIPTTYRELFDPYSDEESVCGDLFDDLSDIASDLQAGMKEYEAGKFGNAIFEWKCGWNGHWGQHVVDALRALHSIRIR